MRSLTAASKAKRARDSGRYSAGRIGDEGVRRWTVGGDVGNMDDDDDDDGSMELQLQRWMECRQRVEVMPIFSALGQKSILGGYLRVYCSQHD